MKELIKKNIITVVILSAVLLVAGISTQWKREPLDIVKSPPSSTLKIPVDNFYTYIYQADNPRVNHVRYKVPGSLIIPLSEVTDYEIKTKKTVELKTGKNKRYPTVTAIPEGVTLKREALYVNDWARVTYEGKTGYIRVNEASVYTIPVVWKENTEWSNLDRENRGKRVGVSAMENALIHLLKPYEWGAEGPTDYDNDGDTREGFDCSGITQWAYNEEGVEIPRTTATGYDQGTQIKREDIEIGDLIYFNPPTSFSPVSHVGMYMGDDMMLHATGAFMEVGISGVYWDRMVSIVRFGE